MRLWIAGASGAALEAWAVVQALVRSGHPCDLAGFLTLDGTTSFPLDGLVCMRESEFLANVAPSEAEVLLAIGNQKTRSALDAAFSKAGFTFPTLVHPAAVVGRAVTIGEGSIVMAGAVLETALSIGRHCLVNVQASVAHECRVGDFCNLGPGVHLPGCVEIGARSDLGTGCVFRPGTRLGPDTVVGAGAVVVGDWPGNVTLAGVPAKPLDRRRAGPIAP
jgi:sugar O-acyltransferase (sialic acid O-acetyltransferase NeuD family)